MGHHLYDKNKQLEAENTALRAELREARNKPGRDASDLVADAVTAFLTGKAFLDVLPGPNVEGSKVIYFRLETPVT